MPKWTYAKSVPEKVYVACSGGVDSVAAAAVLSEWRDVTLLHFSHIDHAAVKELEVVSELSYSLKVPLITSYQTNFQYSSNKEEQWRDARYAWFDQMDYPVVTAHTLDDAVEWYLITCLRGRGEFMPYSRGPVIRPFLLTEKSKMVDYCRHRGLEWWEDPGNHDPNFSLRSRVRNQLLPTALDCEPGLKKMVKRRLVEKISQEKKNFLTRMINNTTLETS